jgi:hypothetical protein
MKIGQPPGSSGLGSSVGGLNSSGPQAHSQQHPGQYQMGGLSGPVKAAHHNRAGMGGQHYQGRGSGVASGSQPHGSLDDSRQSPQHSNQGNNQSFAMPHNQGAGTNQGNDLDGSFNQNNQRSSPINKVGKGNNNLHLSTIQSKPAHHVSPSSAASHAGPS